MAKNKIGYSLYDKAAQFYKEPMFVGSELELRRALDALFKNTKPGQNSVIDYPEQFSMFEVGIFDTEAGKVISTEVKLVFGDLQQFKVEVEHAEG